MNCRITLSKRSSYRWVVSLFKRFTVKCKFWSDITKINDVLSWLRFAAIRSNGLLSCVAITNCDTDVDRRSFSSKSSLSLRLTTTTIRAGACPVDEMLKSWQLLNSKTTSDCGEYIGTPSAALLKLPLFQKRIGLVEPMIKRACNCFTYKSL